MMTTRLEQKTAIELAAGYHSGAVSPLDVTQCILERAERSAGTVNAFCFLNAESALSSARQSEARWRDGTSKSPLDGVPVSIKDNISTTGMPTRFGSRALTDRQIWQPDSPSVARLREAGAVIFAKTCCPEFGHKSVTDSPLTGVTLNPWNLAHTPGGSSGGAAAAVASLIGPLALGTDAGGSIRNPAAFSGVFGFKPSFGRVPHHPRGAYASVSHVGPIARSVEDAALLMNTIAQPDPRDWYALPFEARDYLKALHEPSRQLRIAYSEKLGLADVSISPDVTGAIRKAAETFVELGASVEIDDPPGVQRCRDNHRIMWAAFAARLAGSLGERRSLLDPSMEALAMRGETLPHEAFINAVIARGEVASEINEFFTRYDIVLCPTFHTVAPAIASYTAIEPPAPALTNWCNQTGLPAASIYCGVSKNGMPIGLQIVGKQYADSTVLSACHSFERVFGRSPLPDLAN
jgi:aspartyl-tRNA(Asn)/glutamyl-tRNA(Gln) amidotransferase subunit A